MSASPPASAPPAAAAGTSSSPATTPPAAAAKAADPVTTTASVDLGSGVWAFAGVFALIPILFALMFHMGASFLSYQKYGSAGWAFINFFFAVFYYPYYAFFLSGEPAPAPPVAMLGGKRGGIFKFVKKWF